MPKWSSQTKEIKPGEGKFGDGFSFKAGDGKRFYEYVVTEFDRPRRFRFEEKGGAGFIGTFCIVEENGTSNITFIQEARDTILIKLMLATGQIDVEA